MAKKRSNKKERSGKALETDSDFVIETDAVSSGDESDVSKISNHTRKSERNRQEKKHLQPTHTNTQGSQQGRSRTPGQQHERCRSQSSPSTSRNNNSIKSLTLELKKQLNALLQSTHVNSNEDTRGAIEYCKTLNRKITEVNQDIMNRHQQLDTINNQQERRIDEQNQQIKMLADRIPTAADIAQVVHEEIQDNKKTLTRITKDIQATYKHMQDTNKTMEELLEKSQQATTPEANTQTPAPPTTRSPTPGKISYSQATANTTDKTLIIKSYTDRQTNGATIWEILKKTPLSLPTSSITSITPKSNHLEITCRTHKEKEAIQEHIQQHPQLRDTLTAVTKAVQKQLIILLGIPEHIEDTQITQEIATTHTVKKEDIHLRKLSTLNKDTVNWTALLPTTTAKQMMSAGLILGLHRIRARPFTSVKRCSYCQQFGHSQAQCNGTATCANCGLHHTDANCQKTPHCINCQISNSKHNTTIDTKHQASSNTCPTYRSLYEKERRRLDALFPQQTQTRQPQQNSSQQPRQTAPPANNQPPPPRHRQAATEEAPPRQSHNTLPTSSRTQNHRYYQAPHPSEGYFNEDARQLFYPDHPQPWHYHPGNHWQPEPQHWQHWQDLPSQRWNRQAGDYVGKSFQPFAPLLPTPFY